MTTVPQIRPVSVPTPAPSIRSRRVAPQEPPRGILPALTVIGAATPLVASVAAGATSVALTGLVTVGGTAHVFDTACATTALTRHGQFREAGEHALARGVDLACLVPGGLLLSAGLAVVSAALFVTSPLLAVPGALVGLQTGCDVLKLYEEQEAWTLLAVQEAPAQQDARAAQEAQQSPGA